MKREDLGPCSICGEPAIARYPLLKNKPGFCAKHYNRRDTAPFGCDLSGMGRINREELIGDGPEPFWISNDGKVMKTPADFEDLHLERTITYLERTIEDRRRRPTAMLTAKLEALLDELERREHEKGMKEKANASRGGSELQCRWLPDADV